MFKNTKIRSTFLSLLVRFYGILSIQLTPLRCNPQSLIIFVVNFFMAIFYIYIYQMARKDQSKDRPNKALMEIFKQKPLFHILKQIGSNFAFFFAYILLTIYFIIISNTLRRTHDKKSKQNNSNCELVSLLDSIRVACFDSIASGRRLFIATIVAHQAIYVVTIFPLLIQSLAGHSPIRQFEYLPKWAIPIATYFLFFTLNVHNNIAFILSHYYKYATLSALRAQHTKLIIADKGIWFRKSRPDHRRDINGDDALREFENEMHRLAMINRRLDAILSIPLSIAIVTFVIDITIGLTCLWIDGARFVGNANILQFLLHLTIIASIERQIQARLRSIRQFLEGQGSEVKDETISSKSPQRLFNSINNNNNNWMSQSQINMTVGGRYDAIRYRIESMESVAIRRREVMNVYGKYFRLRLLNIAYVDWSFLFNMTLFVINYVVLVAQTTI